jgi:hypothetical protein
MSGDATAQVALIVVVAIRLLVPLAIPRFPLPGIVASMLVDAVDLNIFQLFGEVDPSSYQGYDKALDVYYLSVAYLSTFRNWSSRPAFEVGRILFYVRLAGVVLFEFTGAREFLLLFPNTFEYYFIFYEVVALRWSPERIIRQNYFAAAAAIWILIKLPQEYWIHIAQLDFTHELKSHPAIIPSLAAAATLVTTAVWWVLSIRVPPPDRRLSVTGARDVPRSGAHGSRRDERLVSKVFNRWLAEKVVLVSLVCIIFGQVLPDVRSETAELVAGVAAVITANTIVSEWLSHRGVGWATASHQFVAMAAVNAAAAFIFSILLPIGADGFIPVGNTLVFLLLLTLLIVLYDRFRPYQAARAREGRGGLAGETLMASPTSA